MIRTYANAVYNLPVPQMFILSPRSRRAAASLLFVFVFLNTAVAADWSGPAEQLARKIVAVTGPGAAAVGGMGADSLLIDAETGAVIKTPPPRSLTRYFRQAHFYFFAGGWQVTLLIIFSALACLSALSGIYLNLTLWLRRGAANKRQVAP